MRHDTTPLERAPQELSRLRRERYTRRSTRAAVAVLAALVSTSIPAAAGGQTAPTRSDAAGSPGGPVSPAAGPRLAAARVGGARSLTSPTATAPPTVRRDSIAHYLGVGRVQRREGGLFVAAGVAAMALAFGQVGGDGRMGLSGGSGAAFVAGAALGLVGGERLVTSRQSIARAAEWAESTSARVP